ncbi:zinc-binding dehydrogenase [Georgfuchsia toluolica]|uniref:zinc-binding dehydrogenase n=1 Tax=Georgfuchsia toluolica TaxID=424218 RepID=UPI001C72E752
MFQRHYVSIRTAETADDKHDSRELQEAADELFAVIASGAVKVAINQRFRLADARTAHEAPQARITTGATLLLR